MKNVVNGYRSGKETVHMTNSQRDGNTSLSADSEPAVKWTRPSATAANAQVCDEK